MHLCLNGHLNWYDPQKRKSIHLALTQPTLLIDVLDQLHVPIAEIVVGVVNGKTVVSLNDLIVTDTDKVELYPPVDGG